MARTPESEAYEGHFIAGCQLDGRGRHYVYIEMKKGTRIIEKRIHNNCCRFVLFIYNSSSYNTSTIIEISRDISLIRKERFAFPNSTSLPR